MPSNKSVLNNTNSILRIENICKSFGEVKVLENISLTVEQGDIILITGENGTGKSTLLKIIAGIIPADSGSVIFDGADITNKSADQIVKLGISSLMQGGIIFPKLYVFEHFELTLNRIGKKYSKQYMDKVYNIFPGIQTLMKKRAGLLSGGERQMLALSILILQESTLWLLDEPVSGLSPETIKVITQSLVKYCNSSGITVILIEQRTKEFQDTANKIYTIRSGKF